MPNKFERFTNWASRITKGKQKPLVQKPEGYEIDYNTHPNIGIGHHIDLNIMDDQGNFAGHMALTPDVTPEQIASGLLFIANNILSGPVGSMSEEERISFASLYRKRAEEIFPGISNTSNPPNSTNLK